MSIYEYIDDGVARNILVYDFDRPGVTLNLCSRMITCGKQNHMRIKTFIFPEMLRHDVIRMMQDNPLLFGPPFNFHEDNTEKFEIMGREIRFDEGLDTKESKYLAYYLEKHNASLAYRCEYLILGVNDRQCLLGSC